MGAETTDANKILKNPGQSKVNNGIDDRTTWTGWCLSQTAKNAEENKKFKSPVLWHVPAANALMSFKTLSWRVVSLFSVKIEAGGRRKGEEL